MIDCIGHKEEWLEFYGMHLEFEKMDAKKRFDDMMHLLAGVHDLRDYLLWHIQLTRPVFGPWNIESHAPFVEKYSARMSEVLAEHNQRRGRGRRG